MPTNKGAWWLCFSCSVEEVVIATGCLHAVGIGIGVVHRWNAGRIALRVAGAAVALAGVYFLWGAVS